MTENTSPFLALQQVERQLKELLRMVDVDSISLSEKRLLSGIRQVVLDARLDVRDYELSETRDAQVKKALEAKKRLDKLQRYILQAGPLFGAADVAQLGAQLDQIRDWLR